MTSANRLWGAERIRGELLKLGLKGSGRTTIAHAHDIMRMHRIRRLPVVDFGHNLVGIVSLADIAAWAELSPADEDGLGGEVLTETLAQIGRWHGESPPRSVCAEVAGRNRSPSLASPLASFGRAGGTLGRLERPAMGALQGGATP
jgi:hypothetical protein